MERLVRQTRFWLGLAALGTMVFAGTGCRMLFTTVAYLVKGTQVDAEFDGLRSKKVVVVCRPAATLTFGNPTVADDLARQLATLLQANVSRIQIVSHQKVKAWTDENDWMDYPEVGKAMNADMVVGVDLLDFSIYRGQTLYQGVANVSIVVHDCKNGKEVYQKHLPQMLWPPNSGIAASEMPEPQFRRRFVRELADNIGRHFYPHDKQSDFARDVDAL